MNVDVSAMLQRAADLNDRFARVQLVAKPRETQTAARLMLRFHFHARRQPVMPDPATEKALGAFGAWFAEFEGLLNEFDALLNKVEARTRGRG